MFREFSRIISGRRLEIFEPRIFSVISTDIKERNPIELIEDLDYPLALYSHMSYVDKMSLLLVSLGEKNGAEISLTGEWPQKGLNNWREVNELLKFEEKMLQIGVNYCISIIKDPGFIGGSRSPTCLVAKDDECMKTLIEAKEEDARARMKIGGDTEFHYKYGLAMGYPVTAVEAFCGDRPLVDEKIQREVSKNNPIFFGLSQEFYREEIKLIQRWSDIIREFSPFLWNQWERWFSN